MRADGILKAGEQCPHGHYCYAEVESENPDYPVGTLTLDCDPCQGIEVISIRSNPPILFGEDLDD